MTPRVRSPESVLQFVDGQPTLRRHRDSGIYYVRYYEDGRELLKSLRTKKLGVAEKAGMAKITEWLGRAPGLKAKKKRIRDLIPDLLKELREEHESLDEEGHPLRRKRTFDKDRTYLDRRREGKSRKGERKRPGIIEELFGNYYPEEVDEVFWDRWVKKKGRKLGRRLGDIAKYLSHVLTFAHEHKYLGRKPNIRSPDKHKKKSIVYENELLRTFIKNADPTLKDLITIAAENPLRPHENWGMQWSFVHFLKDEEGGPITVVKLPAWFVKNEESVRELQVSPAAAEIYQRRFKERDKKSPYVFPSSKSPMKPLGDVQLSRMWRAMLVRVGLSGRGYKFEWIRHSTYTKLIFDAKRPLHEVSQAGGTSYVTLKKHYLDKDFRRTSAVSTAISLKGGEEE